MAAAIGSVTFDPNIANNFMLCPGADRTNMHGEMTEHKLCEGCGRLFFRSYRVQRDAQGLLRHIGPRSCNSCVQKEATPEYLSPKEMVQRIAFIDAYRKARGAYPARGAGAPIKVEGQARGAYRKRADWRPALHAAFTAKPRMLLREIAAACNMTTTQAQMRLSTVIRNTGEKIEAHVRSKGGGTHTRLLCLYELVN
jgi:hypothetical protein